MGFQKFHFIAIFFLFVGPSNFILAEDGFSYGDYHEGINTTDPTFREDPPVLGSEAKCINNMAGRYPCNQLNLEAYLPLSQMGGREKTSDVWGWTDPTTDMEYAILGLRDGIGFLDISNPISPVYLGQLDGHDKTVTSYRDVKTYHNYAFITADTAKHGVQIFDLSQLGEVSNPPELFTETAHYAFDEHSVENFADGFAHNIAINEDSGFAYIVGSRFCNGGLYMLDIITPLEPSFAGCFDQVSWIHDVQCLTYDGPDVNYVGHELCFATKQHLLTIIDVTDKENPVQISQITSNKFEKMHQGWLIGDKTKFLLADEEKTGSCSMTHIIDVCNLDSPFIQNTYRSKVKARASNSIVYKRFVFQANHRAGLRVLDTELISDGILEEVAYFDVFRKNDNLSHDGAIGVFPFLESGIVVISSMREGLFIVRLLLSMTFEPSSTPTVLSSTVPTLLPSSIPTLNPTSLPSQNPSLSPTDSPSTNPTSLPSQNPSLSPTDSPSTNPTSLPSLSPSLSPTDSPSRSPSINPTNLPSLSPSLSPTDSPSMNPTSLPSLSPSINPTSLPSLSPSLSPTDSPSMNPTSLPSLSPSINPTSLPSLSPSLSPTDSPSTSPSINPTSLPSLSPSLSPTDSPSINPTSLPSLSPSLSPTDSPSINPTSLPSLSPNEFPSSIPSNIPSLTPTAIPSNPPSLEPSQLSSTNPSDVPSGIPSEAPSLVSSLKPSLSPSMIPTISPQPSLSASVSPSNLPSISSLPSLLPSINPSDSPNPSSFPSIKPSVSSNPSVIPANSTIGVDNSTGDQNTSSTSISTSNVISSSPSADTPSLRPSVSSRPSPTPIVVENSLVEMLVTWLINRLFDTLFDFFNTIRAD